MSEREYNAAGPPGNEASADPSDSPSEIASDGAIESPDPIAGERTLGDASHTSAFRIDILTLFPDMFDGPFDHSMLARAREAGVLDIRVHDLRDFTHDRHRTTDDYAYGGGGGMVMKPEPIFEAVESILGIEPIVPDGPPSPHPVVLMTPQGLPFRHDTAQELSRYDRLLIIAGHYEGYDERIRAHLATHEVSIGDFVVTGGELPAMLVTDAIARLRPGVIGHAEATRTDSFAEGRDGRLEHPHFTRPADFRGWTIPEVLTSGHHGEVERWRRRASLERTWRRRPELIDLERLSAEERAWINALD